MKYLTVSQLRDKLKDVDGDIVVRTVDYDVQGGASGRPTFSVYVSDDTVVID